MCEQFFWGLNEHFAAAFRDGAAAFPPTKYPADSERAYIRQAAKMVVRDVNLNSRWVNLSRAVPQLDESLRKPLLGGFLE